MFTTPVLAGTAARLATAAAAALLAAVGIIAPDIPASVVSPGVTHLPSSLVTGEQLRPAAMVVGPSGAAPSSRA